VNEITVEAWLEAVRKAEEAGDGFMSVHELSGLLVVSQERARMLVADLHRQGRIECKRILRPCIDGTHRYVPVYKIKSEEKAS
jgi:Mn-dependent DtxR family transcriptional regulator